MFSKINTILGTIDAYVWGIPLIVLILAVGLFLTIRLKGVQFTNLGRAFKYIFKDETDGKHGEVSSFAALCTALSATIGTGNIVGVATAIVSGGPGALFWMWLAALVGTATKYSECLLAVKFRQVDEDGHVVGGPFNYIEHGMGPKWKWLAKIFAFFGIGVGLLGIGTFTQVNGISSAVNNFFDSNNAWTVSLFGRTYSWTVVISCLILTFCVALVLIGGIQRISKVAQVIVPFMAATYFLAGILIILFNITDVPAAILTIVQSAFGLKAAAGGALGAMVVAMQNGIAIVLTGAYDMGLEGVAVTTKAFQIGLPFPDGVASFILMLCLVFFAFTTILGWDYYSERCLEYLTNGKKKCIKAYRWVYILCVFIGPYMTVSAVWTIADIFNGLMAIPNLIALVALSGVVAKETKDYLDRIKKKEID